MKIFYKIIALSMIMLIISSNIQDNKIACLSFISNNRKIVNAAVLLNSFNDLFNAELKQSLEDIQTNNKDEVRFTFYNGKNNITIQDEILDSLLKTNVDLVILNLEDSKASTINDFVLKVKTKDIPVIILGEFAGNMEDISKKYDKAVFVKISNVKESGVLEGEIVADKWKNNKDSIDKNHDNILQYIMLEGEEDSILADIRTKYSVSTINDAGIQTEELAHINANWSKELAKEAISNLFLRYDGRIEAIISNNDEMAIGATEALEKYGYNTGDKLKYIPVVGIDGIPQAKELVDKGIMIGTVIQNPTPFAEGIYKVGLNLINDKNPIENTNYKFVNGGVEVPVNYISYVNKI